MSASKEIIIEVLKVALVDGVPAVMDVINSMNKDTITKSDIEDLKKIINRPEDYFSE